MKKLFLSLVAVIMTATTMMAQTSQVATLNHNDVISVYHGQSAFADAMAAADNGDMITLSSGTYAGTAITKAVTLRGAGIGEETTRITGTVNLSIPESVEEKLSIEGIVFPNSIARTENKVNNITFTKCEVAQFSMAAAYRTSSTVGWKFINCYISKGISIAQGSSATFINSCVMNPIVYSSSSNPSSMEFVNCVVISDENNGFKGSSSSPGPQNSIFTNSLVLSTAITNANNILDSSNQTHNCVGYESTGTTSVFANTSQSGNTDLTTDQYNALFKEGTFYELTDAAKAAYQGNDDTEVGMYGGAMPYDTHVASPHITKCKVASKTTTDGKLSVDIEVKAAE